MGDVASTAVPSQDINNGVGEGSRQHGSLAVRDNSQYLNAVDVSGRIELRRVFEEMFPDGFQRSSDKTQCTGSPISRIASPPDR